MSRKGTAAQALSSFLIFAGMFVFLLCRGVAAHRLTYVNPVIPADFADPTVLRDVDGMYYAYGTQSSQSSANIQVAQSSDLVHWRMAGDALPERPGWADKKHGIWAPDVHRFGDNYYLYYAAEKSKSQSTTDASGAAGMCLGAATSLRAQGPFVDSGAPLLCGKSFIDIDPMAFDDHATGKHLLYWGSGFQPIRVQELAEDRVHFKPGTTPTDVVDIQRDGSPGNYRKLVEGAWVTYRKGWYYIYFSGDNCCGEHAHYAVMVARSHSAFGPFESQGMGVILSRNEAWLAPGHNSTVLDSKGQEWIVYHAIDPGHRDAGRFMMLDRIIYKKGWPTIVTSTPSYRQTRAPVIRLK